ncbi:phage head-binding domain-containing protein [Symbiopectobacterium sp. RP]|uniref:phage head-binding domain-containing protein n=1 Tax=Symbiopectobacterium sp. RP TaxID=3248553 RepID=UPI003D2D50F4
MADITPNVVVSMPSQLFTLRRALKSCSNGKIYIGKIDTDPTIAENQIPVYLENEDGKYTPVAQPLIIGTGGYPVYNGQIAKFVTEEGHAMAIDDAYNVQQFYFPNVLKYDPDQLRVEIASPGGADLVGFSPDNTYLVGTVGNAIKGISGRKGLVIYASENGIAGDGSNSDKSKLEDLMSTAVSRAIPLYIDVAGVYNPIKFISNLVIHVTKDLTLKSNPSTTPQGIQDCLFEMVNVNGFKLTFDPNVVMRSQNHGAYQEFSHCIKIKDGSSNGYIGKHIAYDFDGDGIYINRISSVTIDDPKALRCGRNGISVAGTAIDVVINSPYHAETNPKGEAINLSAIGIEPNEFCEMSLTINNPVGFGGRVTACGLNVYLERIERNAVNHGRFSIVVNNPDFTEYKKNIQAARNTWNLTSGYSPYGRVVINDPILTNHTDNAIIVESWQSLGGIALDIVSPVIVITKSPNGTLGSDSGNVICVTRNQGTWVDNSVIGNVNISDITINDRTTYAHTSYFKCRYGRFCNVVSFLDIRNTQSSIEIITLPEHVRGILSHVSMTARNKPDQAYTTTTTLTPSAALRRNANTGGSVTTIIYTLPVVPIGTDIEVANVVGGSTISVAPPPGMSIGTLVAGAGYDIVNSTQIVRFTRVTAGRWAIL